jgi:hypothetical protein
MRKVDSPELSLYLIKLLLSKQKIRTSLVFIVTKRGTKVMSVKRRKGIWLLKKRKTRSRGIR